MKVVRGAGAAALTMVAALGGAIAPGAGAAQSERWTVEAYGAGFMSPYATLERGLAFGGRLFMATDEPSWLRVGVGGTQFLSRSERDGLVCNRLEPVPHLCHPERLEEWVSIRSYGVGAFPEIDVSWTMRVRGGVGLTINELHARSRGAESGGRGNLYAVPWGHVGGFAEAALLWTPFDHLPVDLMVAGVGSLIWFDSCYEHRDMFTPLCGPSTIGELRLGLSYRVNM